VAVLVAAGEVEGLVVPGGPELPGTVMVEVDVLVGEPPGAAGPTAWPRLSVAGFVWKLRTPARPAIVAITTTRARLISSLSFAGPLLCTGPWTYASEIEPFFVDTVLRYPQAESRRHDAFGEAARSTDINVAGGEIRHEAVKNARVEADLVAWADHRIGPPAPPLNKSGDLVAVHQVFRGRRAHDHGYVNRCRQVL
jgi:hypothetical protein